MAIKASNQISIVDVTDAYSVILTSEAYTFVGNTSGATSGSTCTTEAVAYCGNAQCQSVSVTQADIVCPNGVTASVTNNNTASPKITFTLSATLTSSAEATIPVVVDGITVNKKFSFAVAKTGAKGATGDKGADGQDGVSITGIVSKYAINNSNTIAPTSWVDNPPAPTSSNKYLWTYEIVSYSNNTTTNTTAHIIGTFGATGATGTAGSIWYTGTAITGNSTTATAFSSSGIANARVNDQYLNTSTGFTYKCTIAGNASTAKWVYTGSIKGATGSAGKDAITLSITSSAGTVFKNSSGSTVLTAHVYKAGTEQTIADNGVVANSLGTIKWYKQGTTTAVATAKTYTVNASDVTNVQAYTAQLEG